MSKLLHIVAFLVVLGGATVYGQGIVFKVPDNVFPMDWKKSGFKGMLMLQQDSPSGVFISSPDDGESVEKLRERAAKFIAPMVVHETKDKNPIPFEIKVISGNKGDSVNEGKYYLYKGEKSSVQILFYTRASNGSTFLYGYFASKDKEKKKSSIWADDDGKGVKILKKFVDSFAS